MADPLAVRVAVQLRADARAAGAARHFISATCQANGVDADICSTAALLVSELVTNAVVHARTEVDMRILPSRRRLRVDVTDGAPTGRVEVQPHDVTARGGRGLQLLQVLASDWGTETTATSKTVWFELEIEAKRGDQSGVLD